MGDIYLPILLLQPHQRHLIGFYRLEREIRYGFSRFDTPQLLVHEIDEILSGIHLHITCLVRPGIDREQ